MDISDSHILKRAVISGFPKEKLVDLRSVSIDTRKAVPDRMLDFFAQIKDPYLFKVGDVGVKVSFGAERSFAEALRSAITNGENYRIYRS